MGNSNDCDTVNRRDCVTGVCRRKKDQEIGGRCPTARYEHLLVLIGKSHVVLYMR